MSANKLSMGLPAVVLAAQLLLLLLHGECANAAGYHYDNPNTHFYPTVSTIAPIPPLPPLPPLPTARGKLQQSHPHGHAQSHGHVSAPVPTQSIASAYRPTQRYVSGVTATATPTAHSTRPAAYGQRIITPTVSHYGASAPTAPAHAPIYPHAGQPILLPPTAAAAIGGVSGFGGGYPTTAYGQPTAITGPDADLYQANGRQLKQYAVVEEIDNDIQPSTAPFLTKPFFDHIRARVGASGTGALPPEPGLQLASSADAVLFEQQRLLQSRSSAPTDPITLGSGGLGFVRLSNGNIFLGSGSLGYISNQQHSQFVQDARTRAEATRPDPLHFGHGALGNPTNVQRF